MNAFCRTITPDAEAFLANLRREGTPARVHYLELFLDGEIAAEIARRFGVWAKIDPADPFAPEKRHLAIQRFLGYDFVGAAPEVAMPTTRHQVPDTAGLPRAGGRSFQDEHRGPITNWEEFEKYPWPDPSKAPCKTLAWYEKNLPDDMCVIGNTNAHFCEWLCWLMGYETLCFALHDDRALVQAVYDRILEVARASTERQGEFTRIKAVWGSDDMGFKTGPLISPDDMRRFVLAGHKLIAEMSHARGWLYLLHSCGKLETIWADLLEDVKIDAKHSFEDTIEDVRDVKRAWGGRVSLLGGVDVDFLCRSDEAAIRRRVRETLGVCLPGGGYCLGTGNSVANYIPVDHYLAMMDEGRRYAP